MKLNSTFWKWFGYLSAFLVSAAAMAPDAFNIPMNMRPWLFILAIFWFFIVSSGMLIL